MVMDMEKDGHLVVSFLVRCYLTCGDAARHVYVRSVQDGEEKYFSCIDDALEYIRQQACRVECREDAEVTT